MKHRFIRIIIPLVVSFATGIGLYYRYQSQADAKNVQVSCLAAVIPTVVIHNQQAEIVSLIQQLGAETGDIPVVEAKAAKPSFIFDSDIDKELLKIADLFKQKSENPGLKSDQVSGSVDKVLSLLGSHPSQFLSSCEKLIASCQSSKNEDACLKSLNPKIEKLISALIPSD